MPRPEERWVAACIEAALPGVQVQHHDDGSRPAMYDLDLLRDGQIFAACEVTAAADAESIELWNLINGDGRWIGPSLAGGWMLTLAPTCRAKQLKAEAPALLRQLELDPADTAAVEQLRQYGVLDARQSGTDFPGSIYATIRRDSDLTSGYVAEHGDALVEWFDEWICRQDQAHNLRKLDNTSAAERHIVVLHPGFTSAPFGAADVLMRNDASAPTRGPVLPRPVSHLWLMSTWTAGMIFHWDSECWRTFSKVFEST